MGGTAQRLARRSGHLLAAHAGRGPRALLVLLVAAAAVATAAPLAAPRATPAVARPAATDLDGTWQTVANGDRVRDILRDGSTVWAATEAGGLVRWSHADGTHRQYLAPQDGIAGNTASAVVRLGAHVWVATDRGLSRFDPLAETWATLTPATSPGMPDGPVTALATTPDGALWVGFAQRWDAEAPEPEPGIGPGRFVGGGIARYAPELGAWSEATRAELEPESPVPGKVRDYLTLASDNVTALAVGGDGTVWVGTRPFLVWDRSGCAEPDCHGMWSLTGGGLAGRLGGVWRRWRPTDNSATGCYGPTIADIAVETGAQGGGRAWVAALGNGVLLMRGGAQAVSCEGSQAYYRERRGSGPTAAPGLEGRFAMAVDVDAQRRVWIATAADPDSAAPLSILDPMGTYDDSSGSLTPWATDDVWTTFTLDDMAPDDRLVTDLDVAVPGARLLATRNDIAGDGDGLRALDDAAPPGGARWRAFRTAEHGLPSNHISAITTDAATGATWFATRRRGVSRLAADGTWTTWQAFAPSPPEPVASTTADVARNEVQIPVDLRDSPAFVQAFPGSSQDRFARVGDGAAVYRVLRYIPSISGAPAAIELDPPLRQAIAAGTPIRRLARGPASNATTDVAVAGATVWLTTNKNTWQSGNDGRCAEYPDCWRDGGVSAWSGQGWEVFDPRNSDLADRDIAAVQLDVAGAVWLAQSDRSKSGHGIVMFDPPTRRWVRHRATADLNAGNGPTDLALDPITGDLWATFIPIEDIVTLPGGREQKIFAGGGVARWNGLRWKSWTKADSGSTLKAYGDKGSLYAVLADRANGRVWAGGWDGQSRKFHWPSGTGVDAVLNWCPINDCVANAWQHVTFSGEGQVDALAIDTSGRVWAGLDRFELGMIPPRGGVRLYADGEWSALTLDDSGLPSNAITALAPAGDGMWVGTWNDGAARFMPFAGPTTVPTPSRTATQEPTPGTPPPTTTTPATPATPGTDEPPIATATDGPPDPTPVEPTPTPAPDTPTATAPPVPAPPCGPGNACRIWLPYGNRPR